MKKGLQHYKDWIYIISFVIMLIGFVVKAALLSDQVERNTKEIDEANLKVMIYKLEQIEGKVDLIYNILMER